VTRVKIAAYRTRLILTGGNSRKLSVPYWFFTFGFFQITRTSGSLILVFHKCGTGGSLSLMYLEYQTWWLLKIQIGTQPKDIGNTWGTCMELATYAREQALRAWFSSGASREMPRPLFNLNLIS
jgi:hypothetical protein